jgi:hypothetical protein
MSIGAKYGFSRRGQNRGLNNLFDSLKSKTFDARVVDIILDNSHPRFIEAGEWNGLGSIVFNIISDSVRNNLNYPLARPLFPNIKIYPLKNEVVYCIKLANENINEDSNNTGVYYFPPISIWNNPHHNAIPNIFNIEDSSEYSNQDYLLTSAGDIKKVNDNSTEINLGNTFKERSNIHPLLPFEGDIIMEGRWGNSIRFGSTVKERPNNWSTAGSNGDPITILRNGQGYNRSEGWLPTVEDINKDNSSIYLTSTQKVPINISSTNNYVSYNSNPPQSPNVYLEKQIILNSGRLVFNTTEDHLLLSSKKSINLNSIESINFDTTSPIILQTYPVDKNGGIYLGDKDATESVLKGDLTVDLLNDLINVLIDLSKSLSQQPGVPGGSPLIMINTAGSIANDNLIKLINRLEDLKSKTVKII